MSTSSGVSGQLDGSQSTYANKSFRTSKKVILNAMVFICSYALLTNTMTKAIKCILDLAMSITWTVTHNSINKLVKLLIRNVRHFWSGWSMYHVFLPIGVYHHLERCLFGILESSTLLRAGYHPWICAKERNTPSSVRCKIIHLELNIVGITILSLEDAVDRVAELSP
ncbi:hypothetical protein IW262DRAFT_1292289 [Armillaria fumosa]|nr:hypothetical protein IW262DRAFT_1292289 [Armillaria fumosa]